MDRLTGNYDFTYMHIMQGLSLKGQKDGEDSNFTQLLLLRSIGCPEVLTWMKKKTNKYTSGDIQNEFLQAMALHILWNICSDIVKNGIFTIMIDALKK